ncbi:hypothetical protein RHGRI_026210 [Rhododendron griersonianum]|uniref:Retrovirus-related Pol polyprotein from transposon TNT 1-94 n=1 Tax=Rhododendron griersonianum TaxID=479676 RepID=A0AAV6IU89_9ERIC|nr:hypothetical protein RHGRI_026210 [Rhododendron griersonianum]
MRGKRETLRDLICSPLGIRLLSYGETIDRLTAFEVDKLEDLDGRDWDHINRQTCSFIGMCLVKDQKYFVMRKTNANVLWKKLEEKHMTKSVENHLYLKKMIFRFQYRSGISMTEQLNDYNKILADLLNLDVEILDDDKALLLLNFLPKDYDHLSITLMYGKETTNYDDVSNSLVNNEYRKRDMQAHGDSGEALFVRGRSEE